MTACFRTSARIDVCEKVFGRDLSLSLPGPNAPPPPPVATHTSQVIYSAGCWLVAERRFVKMECADRQQKEGRMGGLPDSIRLGPQDPVIPWIMGERRIVETT